MTAAAPPLRKLLRACPWLAAALSGALLIFCFPPYDQGWLVWIALTPLLTALWQGQTAERGWRNFLLGYVAGAVFFTGTFYWIGTLSLLFESPALRALPLLLGLYLALYFGFWSWLMGTLVLQPGYGFESSVRNLGIGATGAAAWMAHEWVRGWLFSGFGWNGLGVALRRDLPMVQIADLTGTLGVSGLVALANVMAVVIVRRIVGEIGPDFVKRIRWEFSATMLVICAAFAYGAHRLLEPTAAGAMPLRVAVVQPNIPEEEKKFDGAAGEERILAELAKLNGFAASTAPQLMVWPESAVPRGAYADQESHDFVLHGMAQGEFALLTGSLDYELSPDPERAEIVYNAAMLFTEHGARHETYRKIHLVPYGEYLPMRRIMPEAVAALIPGDLAFGQKAQVLTLPKPQVKLGTLICFEDTLGPLAGAFVQNGADLLVNITNDAWFRDTPGAEQHLANATLRAIETRRPLLRCTNSGMTVWVDPHGRVERWLAPFTQGFASRNVVVSTGAPVTFYARHGDWCGPAGAAVVVGVLLRAGLRRRRSSIH